MSQNRAIRVSAVRLRGSSDSNMDDAPVRTGDASRAADGEKHMALRDALRAGKKGILWAIVCASSTVMEGFDLALLGGFYAYPAFQVSLQPAFRPYVDRKGRCEGNKLILINR